MKKIQMNNLTLVEHDIADIETFYNIFGENNIFIGNIILTKNKIYGNIQIYICSDCMGKKYINIILKTISSLNLLKKGDSITCNEFFESKDYILVYNDDVRFVYCYKNTEGD